MRTDWVGDFERDAAAHIRGGDFKAATIFFLKAMQGTPYAGPAKRIASEYVGIDGWVGAAADIARMEAKGKIVTAIGLDITGHNEGPDPLLEFALYDDGAFRFSGALEDARAKALTYGAPWLGCFCEMGEPLSVRNMREFYKAIADDADRWRDLRQVKEPTRAHLGGLAARWYLYFRIHHAVARDIQKGALPKAMKVVVAEHDFGAWFADVYEAVGSAKAARAGERETEARAKAKTRAYDRQTDEIIADFKRWRSSLRGWKVGHNEDKRLMLAAVLISRSGLMLKMLGLPVARPVWELDDSEFRMLLENIKRARETRKRRTA